MVKFIIRTICMTLAAVFCMGSLSAQELKKRRDAGDLKPVAIHQKISPFSFLNNQEKGDASPLYFATSTEDSPAIWKATVGAPQTATQLKTVTSDFQAMEWIDTDGDGEGVIYAVDYGTGNKFGTIDPVTGNFTAINSNARDVIGLAWNPVTNDVYVSLWPASSGATSSFGKIDLATGNYTAITSGIAGATGVVNIAIDNDGVCYAIQQVVTGPTPFGTINLTTGAFTQIATINLATNYVQNMGIDRETNELYWAARIHEDQNPCKWYKINKTTGAITQAGTFTVYNIESFCIVGGGSPANPCPAVTNLTDAPYEGSKVVINWTAPSGEAPTSYKIYNGSAEIGSATAAETTFITENLASGNYTFGVEAIYPGDCIPVKVTVAYEHKTCDIQVTDLTVEYTADCKATLQWTAPSTKSNVIFNESSKDNMKRTAATELINESFANGTLPSGWTNVDVDGDSYKWSFQLTNQAGAWVDIEGRTDAHAISSASYYNGIGDLTPDNWLITPVLALEGATVLTYWVAAFDESYPSDHYGVYVSTTGTDPSDFTLLYEETITAKGEGQEVRGDENALRRKDNGAKVGTWYQRTIDITEIGNCYIAFRHFNSNDWYIMLIDDILVTTEAGGPVITKYNIYRDGEEIASAVEETTFTDEGFVTTEEHTWCVAVACQNGGEGEYVCVTKEICDQGACEPVKNLTVTFPPEIEACIATLKWTAPADMEDPRYNIYRNGTSIATDVSGIEYIDVNIVSNTEYTWKVETVCTENPFAEVKGTCERVSINELESSISIFPNPATGIITVNAKDFVKVEIYNTVGQLITIKYEHSFDVSSYNTGIYFFRVYNSNNEFVTKRIMITK